MATAAGEWRLGYWSPQKPVRGGFFRDITFGKPFNACDFKTVNRHTGPPSLNDGLVVAR